MKNLLFIAALASISSMSFAAEKSIDFAALDSNQDGVISVDEASVNEALKESFSALDIDANGELSVNEVARLSQ
ncbi:MAG: hypothetical protein AAFZ92_09950 [Pseudomonadota bacterium]